MINDASEYKEFTFYQRNGIIKNWTIYRTSDKDGENLLPLSLIHIQMCIRDSTTTNNKNLQEVHVTADQQVIVPSESVTTVIYNLK